MKFNDTISGIEIMSDISEGVSVFSQNSGTGKTYYFKLFSEYCRENKLNCYYGDYQFCKLDEDIIIDICQKGGSDVMILDNADLYLTDPLLEKLRCITKHLLISLHHTENFHLSPCRYCGVYYSENKIEVRYD